MRRAVVLLAVGIGLIAGAALTVRHLAYDDLVGRWAVPELGISQ